MCPIVPMFTWGFVRSNFFLPISRSSLVSERPDPFGTERGTGPRREIVRGLPDLCDLARVTSEFTCSDAQAAAPSRSRSDGAERAAASAALRHRGKDARPRLSSRPGRRSGRTKRFVTGLSGIVLVLALPTTVRATGSAPVVVIVMENHSFGAGDPGANGDTTRYIVGNPDAPYINNTLIPQGTVSSKYYANAHPSLPNYLDIAAGTEAGCTSDLCPTDSIAADNLF